MKKRIGLALLLGIALILGFTDCAPKETASSGSGKIRIGVSLDTLREER